MLVKEDVIIDDDEMEELVEIAEECGRTIDEVIDNHVQFVLERRNKPVELSCPWLNSLRERRKHIVYPADFNPKEAIADYLYDKHVLGIRND